MHIWIYVFVFVCVNDSEPGKMELTYIFFEGVIDKYSLFYFVGDLHVR